MAIASFLRWYRIDAQSLWYDEGISVHQLSRTYGEIIRAAALDTHPPGYYWTLKTWGDLFGSSELALRSLSALWGVIAVALTFLIGRRLFGTAAGVIAALLLAVAPLAVYYSQEVRMYAQVTALALFAVYAYTLRNYWLYALAGLATLYSQYLGVAVLLALNLHALIFWRSRQRTEWLAWLGANAAIGVGFLPWLPAFIDQQSHALNTSPRTAAGLLADTLTAYGGGVAHAELFLWSGALLSVIALAALALTHDKEASSLGLLAWLFPLGLVLVLGLRSGLFEVRYLVLGLPGLFLLVGAALARLKWKVLVVGLLPPAILALDAQYFDPSLARDDYRGLAATIQRQGQPDDAILLVAPNQVEVFGYYYRGPLPMIGLPEQRPIDAQETVERLEAIRKQHDRVWLVSWAMPEADPKGLISAWLADNGFQATHQWYGSVQLALVGFAMNVPTQRIDANLDNGIVLDGFKVASWTLKAGDTLDLTLVWRAAKGPTAEHWKVFTHLLDASSMVVAQRDAEPADNLRPTTSWEHGEQILDNYGISIPSTLPAGSYTLEIGMYSGDRRSLMDGGQDHLVLGEVKITP